MADVGETLVTPATQRLTRGAIAYAARKVILAGTHTASSAYSAEGLQPFMRKVRGIPGMTSSLIGRDQEIAGLLAAVRRVRTDGTGCLIQIGGAPGVGKSRLVAELHARLQIEDAAGLTWLEGRCTELTSDTAYGPFREILRAFARFLPEDPDDVKVARLHALLVTLWQRAGLPRAQLDEVMPFLGNLLSLPAPHGKVAIAALAAEEIHYRTVEAIAAFVAVLGRNNPTVLVVEDLQWADPHSLVVVHQVAARLPEFPLALLCVTRPEPHTLRSLEIAARVCPQRALAVQLADLSPHESRKLVEQLLHLSSVPPALDPLVIGRTEGNPFYIEESLRSLIDADVLVPDNGAWSVDESRLRQVTSVTSDQVPQAVQSVLLSRIDSQPPHIRKALQAAAVVGREVPLVLYSRLLPAGTNLTALIPALEETGFLLTDPAHPHTGIMFRHVLQQMVAYQTVGSAERRALHGRVAQAIAALWPEQEAENVEQLAYHYSRSDDAGKAVEYLARAGARAQQLFLNATAIASYEQALARLGQIADRDDRRTEQARLLASLGRVQHTVGDFAAAAKNLGQAFDLGLTADLPVAELARWAYWQTDALYWAGDAQAVLAACEHAFATLPIVPESQEAAMLNQQMAGAYLSLGPKERFVAISLQTAEYILHLPFSEELASPYHHVIDACLAGKEVDRAWVFIDALHGHAEAAGNFRALAKAQFIAARTCSETGRHAEALVHGERALALAQKTGDVATIQFCLSRLVNDALVLGRFEDADRYGRLEHQFAVESGPYGGEWLMLVGASQLALNQVAAAASVLEQSRVVGAEIGYPVWDEATLWLGRAYQRMGRTEDAISQFRTVLWDTRPNMPSPPFMPDAKPVFLLALAALNELVPDPEQFARVVDPLCTGPWHDEPYFTDAYLVPTPRPAGEPRLPPIDPSGSEWQWVDPRGDCTWSLHNGMVEVSAANGRDLWWTNLSAPRLLHRFAGDLCLQATCTPAADNTPALGGLLIWGDGRNYIRLDLGSCGRREIVFIGCLEGRDIVIGRGRLPTDPIILRVERQGSRVDSFCSNDGSTWYTVGSIDFVGGPVTAGLYAIGLIDRTIDPGAYPDGSRICFTDLRTRSARGPEP
jgi:tetratricopeptide (TPR) repeat protein